MKSIINLDIGKDCGETAETLEEFIIQEKHTSTRCSGNVASISMQRVREIWA